MTSALPSMRAGPAAKRRQRRTVRLGPTRRSCAIHWGIWDFPYPYLYLEPRIPNETGQIPTILLKRKPPPTPPRNGSVVSGGGQSSDTKGGATSTAARGLAAVLLSGPILARITPRGRLVCRRALAL